MMIKSRALGIIFLSFFSHGEERKRHEQLPGLLSARFPGDPTMGMRENAVTALTPLPGSTHRVGIGQAG